MGFAAIALWSALLTRPSTTVDLTMVGRSPAFHAKVEGRDALLLLDTGSFELRLDKSFSHREGIVGQNAMYQLGDLPIGTAPLVVQELEGKEPPPGLGFRTKPDGIIGLDALRHYAIGLDLERGKVTFWPSGNLTSDEVAAWSEAKPARLPLQSSGDSDWFRLGCQIGNRNLSLLLDTGTAYCTVNPSLASVLGLHVIGQTTVQEIGKTERLAVAVAPSIRFGEFPAEFPVLNLEALDDPTAQGILGTEALGNGKFLIDLPGKAFYVSRVSKRGGNPLDRRLRQAGLDLFPQSDRDLRAIVRRGSAAEAAGTESGDRLTHLAGVPVEEVFGVMATSKPTAAQTQQLLRVGMAALGAEFELTFRKADGRRIRLKLPKLSAHG